MKKTLVSSDGKKQHAKAMLVMEPSVLGKALNTTSWKILEMLSKKPAYPLEISQKLKLNEQTAYYHARLLEKAGMIAVSRTEEKNGALCKYFAPAAEAFGVELPGKGSEVKLNPSTMDAKILEFFHEFVSNGDFNGSIVVGSPTEHGPYLTAARDGHYAVQLALFLGGSCTVPNRFIVKLDTETKAENAFARNLIVIGGPVTNIVSSELNEKLKIKFMWDNGWSIISENSKKAHKGEEDGIIAKIKNPWDGSKSALLIAGLKSGGTKSCILALTQFYADVLKAYDKNRDFYCIIRGLDLDGDGKVDSVKVLESFAS